MSGAGVSKFGRRRKVDGLTVAASSPTTATKDLIKLAPAVTKPLQDYTKAQESGTILPALANGIATPNDIIRLRESCLTAIDATAVASLQPAQLFVKVEQLISEMATAQRVQINGSEQRHLATELVDDMLGLGPLEPLLADDSVNDIMVNGPDHTFVERAGKLVEVVAHFRDSEHLTNICQRIAASVGRHVDEATPMVDARLKDGSRVNIVLPPLALNGPLLSIRKFSKMPMDFKKLVSYGSLTPAVAHILEILARCRLNIIISGGTGSGKTTMMNAMSRFIDPTERIVTVEDVAELQLQQPHVARMETRPASVEGQGEVSTRDLVRNALRMRPDRIIVGEVRGAEAFDMLQAMNTGHDGSMSTIHANSARDCLSRIENMVQVSGMGLSSTTIRTELVAAVNIIVQLARQRDGVRRVTQVTEIAGMEGDTVLMNDIFKLKILGETSTGMLRGRYDISRIRPTFIEQLEYFGLSRSWTKALDEASEDSALLAGTH